MKRGRHVYLTQADLSTIRESLKWSAERITEHHAKNGRPEWRDASLAPIRRVQEKLRKTNEKGAT